MVITLVPAAEMKNLINFNSTNYERKTYLRVIVVVDDFLVTFFNGIFNLSLSGREG